MSDYEQYIEFKKLESSKRKAEPNQIRDGARAKQPKITKFLKPIVTPLCVGLLTECERPFTFFNDKPMKAILNLGRKSANEEAQSDNGSNVRDAVFEKYKDMKKRFVKR